MQASQKLSASNESKEATASEPSRFRSRAFIPRATHLRKSLRVLVGFFPLSALGLGFSAVAFLAWRKLGQEKLDLVLLVVGLGGLGLVAGTLVFTTLASVTVRMGLRRLRRSDERRTSSSVHPSTVDTGRWERSGFRVRTPRFIPWARVRWRWREPRAVRVRSVRHLGFRQEEVFFERRGVFEHASRELHVEDVFGLTRVTQPLKSDLSLVALPHQGELRHFVHLSSLAPGDILSHPLGQPAGDRIDLRRYAHGDPARWIHWKAFGRTRKLVVRTPERAVDEVHRTLIYLVTGQNDEAAAALARTLAETRTEEWTFGTDGTNRDATSVADALQLIAQSGQIAPADGNASGLQAFLARNERYGPASLFICAPPEPGPWTERLVTACRSRRGSMRLCVVLDGLSPHRRGPAWLNRLIRRKNDEARPVDKSRLSTTLQGIAPLLPVTLVVDRVVGTSSRPHDLSR